jgi:hypothetical protein
MWKCRVPVTPGLPTPRGAPPASRPARAPGLRLKLPSAVCASPMSRSRARRGGRQRRGQTSPLACSTLREHRASSRTGGHDSGQPDVRRVEARASRRIVALRVPHAFRRGQHRPPRGSARSRPSSSPARRRHLRVALPRAECESACPGSGSTISNCSPSARHARWPQALLGRAAVEPELERLAHQWALLPLRVHGTWVALCAEQNDPRACALANAPATPSP